MKLGIFTDPHYALADRLVNTRRPRLSMGKLKEALDAFQKEQVDAVVCLGDWISIWDTRETMAQRLREFILPLRETGVPVYTCMGNHDAEAFTREEFAALTGFTLAPCVLEDDESRVILLDANAMRDGSPWPPYFEDWTQTALPQEEFLWFKEQLQTNKRCLVGLHQNLDPGISGEHVLENAAEVRRLIHEAGNVRMVLQGHYHFGHEAVLDGIRYHTLTAMCEEEENSFMIYTL